jgi:hypothetical protein
LSTTAAGALPASPAAWARAPGAGRLAQALVAQRLALLRRQLAERLA